MSYDMKFIGQFKFSRLTNIKKIIKSLDEVECFSESCIQIEDVICEANVIKIDLETSAPASMFDPTCSILQYLSEKAKSGFMEAIYDSGEGSGSTCILRYLPGGVEEEEDGDGDGYYVEELEEEAFFEAVRKNNYKKVTEYVKKGNGPNEALRLASGIKMLQHLIQLGADLKTSDALRWACQFDKFAEAKFFIDNGADVNYIKPDLTQTSPLHMACYHGKLRIVKLLLENGADPNISDETGTTAIFLALTSNEKKTKEIITLLIKYNAQCSYEFENKVITIENYKNRISEELYTWFLSISTTKDTAPK